MFIDRNKIYVDIKHIPSDVLATINKQFIINGDSISAALESVIEGREDITENNRFLMFKYNLWTIMGSTDDLVGVSRETFINYLENFNPLTQAQIEAQIEAQITKLKKDLEYIKKYTEYSFLCDVGEFYNNSDTSLAFGCFNMKPMTIIMNELAKGSILKVTHNILGEAEVKMNPQKNRVLVENLTEVSDYSENTIFKSMISGSFIWMVKK